MLFMQARVSFEQVKSENKQRMESWLCEGCVEGCIESWSNTRRAPRVRVLRLPSSSKLIFSHLWLVPSRRWGRCHGLFSGLFAEVRVPSAYLPTNRHEIDSTLKTPLSFTEHAHY